MVYVKQDAQLCNLDYLYPSRPAWDRGRKGPAPLQFVTSDSEDCVVFLNESHSMNSTYIYRTVDRFLEHRDQLKEAVAGVKFWNDGDIPVGVYTVPVTVAHHMGSLRMYVRAHRNHIRLSKEHCDLLLWMFDKAIEELKEWNYVMERNYENYRRMPYDDNEIEQMRKMRNVDETRP